MNTFLPYPDFKKSAECLDNKRLGKQRVEAWQIYQTLQKIKETPDEKFGWKNHPAVLMWKGYELALCYYGSVICKEWTRRGFKDTMLMRFCSVVPTYNTFKIVRLPPFIGNKEFHASHRSNLLRKDPKHYGQFGWSETNNLPYIWGRRNKKCGAEEKWILNIIVTKNTLVENAKN